MINFLKALDDIGNNIVPVIEYRLYYDKLTGAVLFYSTDCIDKDFIVITHDEYNIGRYDVSVYNNAIIYPTEYIYQKLTPSNTGTICLCDDVSVVSNSGQAWKLTLYE